MSIKIIGAVLIVACCGWFGFSVCTNYKIEERTLRQLMNALDYMGCELQYRMTPLPELCKETANTCKGGLQALFLSLSRELEEQVCPDAAACMKAAVMQQKQLPGMCREILLEFGESLGCFDLPGQLNGLESARQSCRRTLETLSENRDVRLRSYQTLGLCAGAALVVLFI